MNYYSIYLPPSVVPVSGMHDLQGISHLHPQCEVLQDVQMIQNSSDDITTEELTKLLP